MFYCQHIYQVAVQTLHIHTHYFLFQAALDQLIQDQLT